jgi:hypothetical protein
MYTIEHKCTYYLVDRDKGGTFEIGNHDELINYLSNHFVKENGFENYDLTGNDKCWRSVEYYGWKKYFIAVIGDGQYVTRYVKMHEERLMPKPYMLIDDKGTIINPRDFDKEIKMVKHNIASFYNRKYNGDEYGVRLISFSWHGKEKKTFRFRCDPVPHIHNHNNWHFSHVGHRAQLWKNRDNIRPKNRIDWADLWDPKERHVDRCWKSSSKARHQWAKHIK